ncbi:uncharacterized protein PHACADRAFT_185071 [Phanerochaete carnosa HHB-10118-sp]|uniref:XPG-I domain-containing protein n=1 Tax=Phanerochaete carnosa (strain HHB-10118-sp) TaxID=650164 RepID=K5UVN0_PHACS|nr:uncharacterized protein PHACADRAFT_185071 [Phanerochaete carnosa HHB-10118-sp]EKM54091.1 hypothetical protein PHACADRAFT_185071 [Phanerochaete carnosa HHB-10118-sp]
MGVQGLWEAFSAQILEPAGQSRSLTKIAVVDGFEGNESGRRGYRIGIDASIWYQHGEHSTKAGANPELRLLFFRLARLAKLPWLVLFVFDGRERPTLKRGSRVGKSGTHNLTQEFKAMIECFGMEWRMARGEAEAELAYLNAQGIIDAIITDDVDTLVFGARTVIRNSSITLAGNRNNPATDALGQKSDQHTMVFTSDRIGSHPNIGLTRGGMVLIALLSGGDYDNGVKGLGPKIAHGLARCGFGDRLLTAYRTGEAHFRAYLPRWRDELNTELRTNASGMLPHCCSSAAVSPNWPDMITLTAYFNPVCSALNGQGTSSLALQDRDDLSLPRLAKFCEDHFDEWGHRSRILERFHNFMYEGAVFHVLRRAALEADEKEKTKRLREGKPGHIREPLRATVLDAIGTPASLVHQYLDPAKRDLREERLAEIFVNRGTQRASTPVLNIPDTHPLIESIVGQRTHLSTDSILEYRVVIRCKQLDDLANKGITGKHPEPAAVTKSQNLPDEDGVYGTGGAKKTKKPVDRSTKRIWVAASIMRQVHPGLVTRFQTAGPPRTIRRKRQTAATEEDEDEDDSDSAPEFADEPSSPVKSQPTPIRAARQAASAPADAYKAPPVAPMVKMSQPPRRPHLLHNVGDINFERSTNRNTSLFTFSDPCDPDMMISDEEDPPIPEFVVGSSSQPAQSHARTLPSRDIPSDNDEPFPTLFTSRQEAIIDKALGITSGGGYGRTGTRKSPQPRKRVTGGASTRAARADASNINNPAPPRAAASQPPRISARPQPTSSETRRDEPMPSMFSATQEAIIDRALGIPSGGSGSATTTKAKSKRSVAPARRAGSEPMSAVLLGAGHDPAGGNSMRAKATSTRKRAQAPAIQPTEGTQQAKRRRMAATLSPEATDAPLPLPSASAPAQSTPTRRHIAPFPDLSPLNDPNNRSYSDRTPPPSRARPIPTGGSIIDLCNDALKPPRGRPIPTGGSIIDISDDEPPAATSSKRAPVASRVGGWGTQMPSSSQDSRLTDPLEFRFDFDLT